MRDLQMASETAPGETDPMFSRRSLSGLQAAQPPTEDDDGQAFGMDQLELASPAVDPGRLQQTPPHHQNPPPPSAADLSAQQQKQQAGAFQAPIVSDSWGQALGAGSIGSNGHMSQVSLGSIHGSEDLGSLEGLPRATDSGGYLGLPVWPILSCYCF